MTELIVNGKVINQTPSKLQENTPRSTPAHIHESNLTLSDILQKEMDHDIDLEELEREIEKQELVLVRRTSCTLLSSPDDTTWQKIKLILNLCIPAIINNQVRMLMELVNLTIIGTLNNNAMIAGVGMGNMTINMIGMSVIMGFNSALDTLISQGAGANKLELCGVFRLRGMFFVSILFIPIALTLCYSYEILVSIGQHKEVAEYSQMYIYSFLPGLYLSALGECQLRFLNNLGKTKVSAICSFLGVSMHYFTSYFFVVHLGLGFSGLGVSLFCAYLVMFVCMLVYEQFQQDIKEAAVRPDQRVFQDLGAYFWLGLPYTFMVMIDQWAWELLVLLAGFFTINEQAAQIILVTITSICYTCGLGLDQTACAIVGFRIGSGQVHKARQYYRLLIVTSFFIVMIQASTIYIFQEQIVHLFTSESHLADIANKIMYLIIIASIPDSQKGMLKGVIKALVLQKQCTYLNMIGHWGINLSLQIVLAFYYEMNLYGLWTAKIILEIYILTSYAILIHCQDWDRISQTSRAKLEKDDARTQELFQLNSPGVRKSITDKNQQWSLKPM